MELERVILCMSDGSQITYSVDIPGLNVSVDKEDKEGVLVIGDRHLPLTGLQNVVIRMDNARVVHQDTQRTVP